MDSPVVLKWDRGSLVSVSTVFVRKIFVLRNCICFTYYFLISNKIRSNKIKKYTFHWLMCICIAGECSSNRKASRDESVEIGNGPVETRDESIEAGEIYNNQVINDNQFIKWNNVIDLIYTYVCIFIKKCKKEHELSYLLNINVFQGIGITHIETVFINRTHS